MSEPPTTLHRAKAHDVLEAARSWLDKDGRVALATVVGTWGSAPVGVGGQMVVAQDGRFEGSVSGGCVEGEVIAEAEDIMAERQAQDARVRRRRRDRLAGGPAVRRPDQGVPRAAGEGRRPAARRPRPRCPRQPARHRRAHAPRATAATRCSAATTSAPTTGIRAALRERRERAHRDAGRRGVRARPGAAGARAHHRRHPHRPDPGAAREDRRLRGDGDRSAHGLRRRGALPRHPPRHRMAAGHDPQDRPRPLHGGGGAGPRRPHRRRGAQARHALGLLLHRRARLQAQPRQAHRSA